MEELNEWDDILITLQLAYKENKTPDAIKTAARLIRQRVKETECFDFLSVIQRSPAPVKVLAKEIESRRPNDVFRV